MKNKLWIPIITFVVGLLLSFVVFGQTPAPVPVFVDVNEVPWADPNVVDGKVLPITMLSDEMLTVLRRETAPGVVTEYTLVGTVDGLTFDITTPNEVTLIFRPSVAGVYYFRMDAKVISPYEGRSVRSVVAVNVVPTLLPTSEWFYDKVPI